MLLNRKSGHNFSGKINSLFRAYIQSIWRHLLGIDAYYAPGNNKATSDIDPRWKRIGAEIYQFYRLCC